MDIRQAFPDLDDKVVQLLETPEGRLLLSKKVSDLSTPTRPIPIPEADETPNNACRRYKKTDAAAVWLNKKVDTELLPLKVTFPRIPISKIEQITHDFRELYPDKWRVSEIEAKIRNRIKNERAVANRTTEQVKRIRAKARRRVRKSRQPVSEDDSHSSDEDSGASIEEQVAPSLVKTRSRAKQPLKDGTLEAERAAREVSQGVAVEGAGETCDDQPDAPSAGLASKKRPAAQEKPQDVRPGIRPLAPRGKGLASPPTGSLVASSTSGTRGRSACLPNPGAPGPTPLPPQPLRDSPRGVRAPSSPSVPIWTREASAPPPSSPDQSPQRGGDAAAQEAAGERDAVFVNLRTLQPVRAKSSARATRVHALLDAELFDVALAGSGPARADPTPQEVLPTGQMSGPLNQDTSELRISPNAPAAEFTPETSSETQVKLHLQSNETVSVHSRRKVPSTTGRRQAPAPHPFTPDPSAIEAGAPDIPASSSHVPHSDVGAPSSPLPDPPAAPPEPPARVPKPRPELGQHRQSRDGRNSKPATLDQRGADRKLPNQPLATFAASEKPSIGAQPSTCARFAKGADSPRKRAGISLERPGRLRPPGSVAFKSPRPADGAAPGGGNRGCMSPPAVAHRVLKAAPVSRGRPIFLTSGNARVQRTAPRDGPLTGSGAPGLGDEVEFLKNGEVLGTAVIEAESGAKIPEIGYVLPTEEVGVKLIEVKRAFAHVEIEPVDEQVASIGELCRLGNVFPWKKSWLRHPV